AGGGGRRPPPPARPPPAPPGGSPRGRRRPRSPGGPPPGAQGPSRPPMASPKSCCRASRNPAAAPSGWRRASPSLTPPGTPSPPSPAISTSHCRKRERFDHEEGVMPETFRALVLTEEGGNITAQMADVPMGDLPDHDVLVEVAYPTLNYKDGLAVNGQGRVVRQYPMVPGIDYAGTVVESRSPMWKPGDHVILTGWEVGEKHWGGFGQRAR